MSTLRSELEELKKTYNESVKSTKESIASSFSIFSDVSLTKTDDENGLVVNLQRQVDALQNGVQTCRFFVTEEHLTR